MRDEEVERLSQQYQGEAGHEESGLLRIAGPLGLNLTAAVALGDEIVADLDKAVHGIGWWKAYPDLDQQTRILLSDYLTACARAIPDNLAEAQVERLEHDCAAEDFRKWMSRGVTAGERSTIEPPRSAYEELATHRVQAHLAGALRAWGSALDCVGGCIIGVAGLPSNLVKADLDRALKSLARESQKNPVLAQLQADLQQAETAAGPAGWHEWLLGMRNTYVHRGRRNVTWNGNLEGNEVADFSLRLPIAADLTEVEAVILAGGVIAATFTAPATGMFDELTTTIGTYISEACRILTELWLKRRANPALLAQSPKQWKQPEGLIVPPAFHGFPGVTLPPSVTTSFGVSPEGELRLRSAALRPDVDDIRPDPGVWN